MLVASCPSTPELGDKLEATSVALRLTGEEWNLVVSALSVYQHNQTYRRLYERLAAQV